VIGLDISRQMLSVAQRRICDTGTRVVPVRGDMLRIPFRGEPFDDAVCMDVTFGYFGPEGDCLQLQEISRTLKEGGRLFVVTFDKEHAINNPGKHETGQYWDHVIPKLTASRT
jgi:ubiquinone/menaquinone biosynthesis C-methylase UbiE